MTFFILTNFYVISMMAPQKGDICYTSRIAVVVYFFITVRHTDTLCLPENYVWFWEQYYKPPGQDLSILLIHSSSSVNSYKILMFFQSTADQFKSVSKIITYYCFWLWGMESSAVVAHLPQSLKWCVFWEAFLLTAVVMKCCLSLSLPVNFLSTDFHSGHCSLTFLINKTFLAS